MRTTASSSSSVSRDQPTAAGAANGCSWPGDSGTSAYISHDVGRPRVIEELLPSVWIMSDRPGLQFAADVVASAGHRPPDRQAADGPRVRRQSTTIRAAGSSSASTASPHLLARQLRVLRSQLGTDVDGREAYIHRVLLNVYGVPA